jgi:hypothetical protein
MRLSKVLWVLCIIAGIVGIGLASYGLYKEVTTYDIRWLVLVIVFPCVLAVSGVLATLADKRRRLEEKKSLPQ